MSGSPAGLRQHGAAVGRAFAAAVLSVQQCQGPQLVVSDPRCARRLYWAGRFRLARFDVGQGDGIFYRFESGTCIFIDGGSSDRKQLGDNVIMPFLKYNGIQSISYWFVSHADSDHISGLSEVIDSGYTIEHIVVAEAAAKEEAMEELLFKAKEAGIDICLMSKGDSIEINDASGSHSTAKHLIEL